MDFGERPAARSAGPATNSSCTSYGEFWAAAYQESSDFLQPGAITLKRPARVSRPRSRRESPPAVPTRSRSFSGRLLPIAMATLRRNPAYLARWIGTGAKHLAEFLLRRALPVSPAAARSEPGARAGSAVTGARRFQGHTSWQMSQPNTWRPMPGRSGSGTGPAQLDGEVRRCTGANRAPRLVLPGTPVGTMAAVGHASMQRVHEPQRSAGGWSGARSSDSNSSPRKNHEPRAWLIRQVFLAIQPRPACRAYARSSSGAVSTQIFHSCRSPSFRASCSSPRRTTAW